MKIKATSLAVMFLIISLAADNFAQILSDSVVFREEAEKQFSEGMSLFQAGRLDTAAALFSYSIKEFPRNHRATGSCIMGGKAYYELKNYRESIRLLKDLIDLYPNSTYIDDAHYTLGLNYYSMGRYEDAASEFIYVAQRSSEQRNVVRSKAMLELITSEHLSASELQLLQADAVTDEMKGLVLIRTAEKRIQAGEIAVAVEILRQVATLPPAIKYVGEALSLLSNMEKRGGVKIGVLLPLMIKSENASLRSFGVEFLQGIQVAVDEYNQVVPMKITLDIRDTERDPSVAARQVADLCNDENVSVIVGPILSNEVFSSAGIANERGVPLVSPTATANGIAAIGPFIFQANPDYNMRGRGLMAYAYNELGGRKFAVLAPADAIGKQMAESFISEVNVQGGEIVDVQWYAPGSNDLRTELTTMRRKVLEKLEVPTIDFGAKMKQAELNKFIHWGVNTHVLDSLIERGLKAPVTLLFGVRGAVIADSLRLPTTLERINYDSLGLPVTNIDAIFIPIASSDEIPIISSQLKYFNIQAQVLGTGDWNDMTALDQNRQYTQGTMFTVDTYLNSESEAYKTFSAKYQLAYKTLPGTNALFGYDVAKMIVKIISQGKTKRAEIAAALSAVEGFEGLHSKISLSRERVNSYLIIVQYKGKKIVRIGDVDLARQRK